MTPFRMWDWTLLAAICLGAVAAANPESMPVIVHKAALCSLGAVLGMWFDRSAFPYGRPDHLVDPSADGKWEIEESIVFSGACLRRAAMMIGFVIAFGWAL